MQLYQELASRWYHTGNSQLERRRRIQKRYRTIALQYPSTSETSGLRATPISCRGGEGAIWETAKRKHVGRAERYGTLVKVSFLHSIFIHYCRGRCVGCGGPSQHILAHLQNDRVVLQLSLFCANPLHLRWRPTHRACAQVPLRQPMITSSPRHEARSTATLLTVLLKISSHCCLFMCRTNSPYGWTPCPLFYNQGKSGASYTVGFDVSSFTCKGKKQFTSQYPRAPSPVAIRRAGGTDILY